MQILVCTIFAGMSAGGKYHKGDRCGMPVIRASFAVCAGGIIYVHDNRFILNGWHQPDRTGIETFRGTSLSKKMSMFNQCGYSVTPIRVRYWQRVPSIERRVGQ